MALFLLLHIGTHPDRKDKFYRQLPQLISYLHNRKYTLTTINDVIEVTSVEKIALKGAYILL